jgi:hypothetical protein
MLRVEGSRASGEETPRGYQCLTRDWSAQAQVPTRILVTPRAYAGESFADYVADRSATTAPPLAAAAESVQEAR